MHIYPLKPCGPAFVLLRSQSAKERFNRVYTVSLREAVRAYTNDADVERVNLKSGAKVV